MVKQQVARVNINTSKPKWKGMGEFNLDDYYIYYMGENPLEEMV